MKAKAHLLLVTIICIFFTSCDPDDTFYDDATIQNIEQCCGELGDIPSEPDEDEEED